jgi:hypothetical protein
MADDEASLDEDDGSLDDDDESTVDKDEEVANKIDRVGSDGAVVDDDKDMDVTESVIDEANRAKEMDDKYQKPLYWAMKAYIKGIVVKQLVDKKAVVNLQDKYGSLARLADRGTRGPDLATETGRARLQD